MKDLKDFFEFVRENPPLALPGNPLYTISMEGRIEETNSVEKIILDKDGNWKIVSEQGEINGYFLSKEKALNARNAVKVEYLILEPSEDGEFFLDVDMDNCYRSIGSYTIDVSNLRESEDFVTAIIERNKVHSGSVINLKINDCLTRQAFRVLDNKYESVNLESVHGLSLRIYEEIKKAFEK